jgi:hypothetical protein
MPKQKPTSIADITEILQTKFKDEVLAVPGETTLDTVKRILSAIVPEDAPESLPTVRKELNLSDIKMPENLNLPNGLALEVIDGIGTVIVDPSKLLVDKRLFFEMFASMVRGQYIRYLNLAGGSRIAKIMGARTRDEEKKCQRECEEYLKSHKH